MTNNFSLYHALIKSDLCDHNALTPFAELTNAHLFELVKTRFQVNEKALLTLVATEYSNAIVSSLSDLILDPDCQKTWPFSEQKKKGLIPIYAQNKTLAIAVDNPFNSNISELSQTYNLKLFYIPHLDMATYFGKQEGVSARKLLDDCLIDAIENHSSDLHFYQQALGYDVYTRVHGELRFRRSFASQDAKQLRQLIKLHSKMDISFKNQAQDGQLSFAYENQAHEFRVSAIPTVFGEDFVLRLSQKLVLNSDFASLGFKTIPENNLKTMLQNQTGLILVTGPTGSGKTTTLYQCLNYLKQHKQRNIVTMEDPVENILPGIRQSPINAAAGYTFSTGLRAILRQDPDVIMVGEIRDQDTAKTALDAAYTGHLVLSTLHTSDAASTLLRLKSFNLDPFLIQYNLKGIVSQQLVPNSCSQCQSSEGCEACSYLGNVGRQLRVETLLCKPLPPDSSLFSSPEDMIKYHDHYTFQEDMSTQEKMSIKNVF